MRLMETIFKFWILVGAAVAGEAIWGQPSFNGQRTGVNPNFSFLPPADSPNRYPGLLLSNSLDSTPRQVVVDSAGNGILLTDAGTCWQYVPEGNSILPCEFQGQSAVIGEQDVIYSAGAYRLRRYDGGAETWVVEDMEFSRVNLVDRLNRPYATGNAVTSVFTNGTIRFQYPSSVVTPAVALSASEEILFFQSGLDEMQALSLENGEILWTLTLESAIESFVCTGEVVIVDTVTLVAVVHSNGTILQIFTAVERIQTSLIYGDRIIVNRDGKFLAISLDDFSQLYELEGYFDFVSAACGVQDLFFIPNQNSIFAFKVSDGSEVWTFRLDRDVNRLIIGGNGILMAISGNIFQVIDVFSAEEQGKEAFPLWFLGWIIPLVLLFIFFIYFVYRLNTRRTGYDVIN